MAQIVLNNLALNTNYKSKDLDIVNFNSIIAQIQLFVNTLNANVKDLNSNITVKIVVSETEPEGAKTGDLWLKILN